MTERPAMLKRAIEHYIKKLRSLKEDKEDKQVMIDSDIFTGDLEANATLAGKAYDNFKYEFEYREILCYALRVYVDDLEKSKEAVRRKLPDVKLRFENIDRELKIAWDAQGEICQGHGLNLSPQRIERTT
ncbi:hypothetical protein [Nitrososphaera sp. AFS]|uniref:hypothetical protein n=1 Tax=Nitrososphaera sp. AFS TaxID=2301191 RepID=UPI00139232AE|nr:hypothetical protein [Nitrososphaera sp. AFS]NAL77283.1 hypothetical protein [Nitrososphaera sp. AFS]